MPDTALLTLTDNPQQQQQGQAQTYKGVLPFKEARVGMILALQAFMTAPINKSAINRLVAALLHVYDSSPPTGREMFDSVNGEDGFVNAAEMLKLVPLSRVRDSVSALASKIALNTSEPLTGGGRDTRHAQPAPVTFSPGLWGGAMRHINGLNPHMLDFARKRKPGHYGDSRGHGCEEGRGAGSKLSPAFLAKVRKAFKQDKK